MKTERQTKVRNKRIMGIIVFTFLLLYINCESAFAQEATQTVIKSAKITLEGELSLHSERKKTMPETGDVHLFSNLAPVSVPVMEEWNIYKTAILEPAFYIQIWDSNSSAQYTAYCLDYGLKTSSNMNMEATDLRKIGGEEGRLLRATLSFGYSEMVVHAELTDTHKAKYAATQAVLWSIRSGIYGTEKMDQVSKRFFSYLTSPNVALEAYNELVGNVNTYQTIPSFTTRIQESAPEYEMLWNKSKDRYEVTLEDKNNILQSYEFNEGEGIEIEKINEYSLLFFSKEKKEKKQLVNGKKKNLSIHDAAVFYWNSNNNYQRLACLDLDSKREEISCFLNLKINMASIELEKVDSETMTSKAQGKASLEGAVYDVFYADYKENAQIPDKSYVCSLTIDKSGKALTDKLPLGTYTLKERIAPYGYSLDSRSHEVVLKKDEEGVVKNTLIKADENVIRGDVQIIKIGEEVKNSEKERRQPLQDVRFTFTSKTTGEEVQIITDKYGVATTKNKQYPRGRLIYDTYIVTESNTPNGYISATPFEITIENEMELLSYVIENKIISVPLRVVKIDASTKSPIPVQGTEFQILDKDKKVVSMETFYPERETHRIFKTDSNGQFLLPDKLKKGIYYLEEIKAPKGYLVGTLLKFEIREGGSWDNPIVLYYENENVMGKIEIHKKDANTGVMLSGVGFEVVAKESIITPDKTMRVEKGTVVDRIVTNEKGIGVSKLLYLGAYTIREVSAAPGYIKSKEEYPVTLEYEDQHTKIVTKPIVISNLPEQIILKPVDEVEKAVKTGDIPIMKKIILLVLTTGFMLLLIVRNQKKYR